MDDWSEEQMLKMELGGNQRFKNFLKQKGIDKVNYRSEELVQYKRDLEEKVESKAP